MDKNNLTDVLKGVKTAIDKIDSSFERLKNSLPSEAPNDNKQYVRKNKAWQEVSVDIPKELPQIEDGDNGKVLGVVDNEWNKIDEKHLFDNKLELRQNDHWETYEMPALKESASWSCVCYGGDRFIAVARGTNQAAYSLDGSSWVEIEMPKSASWSSIAYGYNYFVAADENSNEVALSKDGFNWTLKTYGSYNNKWNSVYFYNNDNMFGGGSFYLLDSSLGKLCNIYQLQNYGGIDDFLLYHRTTETSLPDDATWNVYVEKKEKNSNGVVGIIAGNDETGSARIRTLYSWNEISLFEPGRWSSDHNWVQAVPGDDGIVFMSDYSEISLYQLNDSTDAVFNLPLGFITPQLEAIAFGDNKYVALAGNTYSYLYVYYSYDGINWNKDESFVELTAPFNSLCYGAGKFVAVSSNSNLVLCGKVDCPKIVQDNEDRTLDIYRATFPKPISRDGDILISSNGAWTPKPFSEKLPDPSGSADGEILEVREGRWSIGYPSALPEIDPSIGDGIYTLRCTLNYGIPMYEWIPMS